LNNKILYAILYLIFCLDLYIWVTYGQFWLEWWEL